MFACTHFMLHLPLGVRVLALEELPAFMLEAEASARALPDGAWRKKLFSVVAFSRSLKSVRFFKGSTAEGPLAAMHLLS